MQAQAQRHQPLSRLELELDELLAAYEAVSAPDYAETLHARIQARIAKLEAALRAAADDAADEDPPTRAQLEQQLRQRTSTLAASKQRFRTIAKHVRELSGERYTAARAQLLATSAPGSSPSGVGGGAGAAASPGAQGATSSLAQRRSLGGHEQILQQSRDLTASLQRSRLIMSQELSRMNEVNAVLESDSSQLQDVSGAYGAYGASIKQSKALLQTIERRNATDRVLVYIGVGCFLLVVLFILWRRLRFIFKLPGFLIRFTSWIASFLPLSAASGDAHADAGLADLAEGAQGHEGNEL